MPPRKIPEEDLRTLHWIYLKGQLSTHELAQQIHQRYGYADANSAAVALLRLWHKRHLKIRTKAESIQIAVARKPHSYSGKPLIYDRTTCLQAGRQYILEHGKPPSADTWKQQRRSPCVTTITKRFGSWAAYKQELAAWTDTSSSEDPEETPPSPDATSHPKTSTSSTPSTATTSLPATSRAGANNVPPHSNA